MRHDTLTPATRRFFRLTSSAAWMWSTPAGSRSWNRRTDSAAAIAMQRMLLSGAESPGGNGSEFTAAEVMRWLRDAVTGPTFIAPDSPWQNGFVANFNGRLHDKLPNREWFHRRAEARVLIERRRQFYNEHRPHRAPRYQPPATVRRARLDSDNIDARLTARSVTKFRFRSRIRASASTRSRLMDAAGDPATVSNGAAGSPADTVTPARTPAGRR